MGEGGGEAMSPPEDIGRSRRTGDALRVHGPSREWRPHGDGLGIGRSRRGEVEPPFATAWRGAHMQTLGGTGRRRAAPRRQGEQASGATRRQGDSRPQMAVAACC